MREKENDRNRVKQKANDREKKQKNCIIDITTVHGMWIKIGQTICILKFALLIFSCCLFALFVHAFKHVATIDDPLSKSRNYIHTIDSA